MLRSACLPCYMALIGVTNFSPGKFIANVTGHWRHKLPRPGVLSAILLWVVFGSYVAHWVRMHAGFLFMPALQNDDVRTAVFPFHRYGLNPWLANDPIAREMMAYVTPGLWVLYRCLVPITDIFVASKCVQGLALGVLFLAGWVLLRSRRAGLAAGLLLVFLVLSDSYAVGRIAGGHARSFGFPCFALWVAGVLSKSRWARITAPLIGALFYPAVMLMILAAEGFYSLRDLLRWRLTLRRLRRYALVVAACGACCLPSVIGADTTRGPIHTLEQAARDPAFYGGGRLWVLPLGNPADQLMSAFLARFSASGICLFGGKAPVLLSCSIGVALFVATLFIVFRWLGWASISPSVVSFLLGSVTLYFAARGFAFRLYSTERYYAYGMRMTACLLLVAVAWQFMANKRRLRFAASNILAATVILLQWSCLGDGIIRNNGMTLDAHWDADLYGFIRSLPLTVRFASHPMDGDGIPYYGARATVGSFETLQPWFVDSWKRQKVREYATLDAFYSPNFADIVAYGKAYSVTHLLVNRDRYGNDYVQHVSSFEPFTSYSSRLVNQPNRDAPALTHIPSSAIVFERPPWVILDLEKLGKLATLPDHRN